MEKIFEVKRTDAREESNLAFDPMINSLTYVTKHTDRFQYKHLHWLSDEKPEQGDYFIVDGLDTVHECIEVDGKNCESNNGLAYAIEACKKIEFTTDGSLRVPYVENHDPNRKSSHTQVSMGTKRLLQIPTNFIKTYADKQGDIGKVRVEFEEKLNCGYCNCLDKAEEENEGYPVKDYPCLGYYTPVPLRNTDGTVVWSLVEDEEDYEQIAEEIVLKIQHSTFGKDAINEVTKILKSLKQNNHEDKI